MKPKKVDITLPWPGDTIKDHVLRSARNVDAGSRISAFSMKVADVWYIVSVEKSEVQAR